MINSKFKVLFDTGIYNINVIIIINYLLLNPNICAKDKQIYVTLQ